MPRMRKAKRIRVNGPRESREPSKCNFTLGSTARFLGNVIKKSWSNGKCLEFHLAPIPRPTVFDELMVLLRRCGHNTHLTASTTKTLKAVVPDEVYNKSLHEFIVRHAVSHVQRYLFHAHKDWLRRPPCTACGKQFAMCTFCDIDIDDHPCGVRILETFTHADEAAVVAQLAAPASQSAVPPPGIDDAWFDSCPDDLDGPATKCIVDERSKESLDRLNASPSAPTSSHKAEATTFDEFFSSFV